MATTTPNLSLVKPAGSDAAAVSVLNGNMDILDAAATLTGSQTLSAKTLTAPHMTGPIVDAGGLTITSGGETITAGGLTVTAGNVGIGGAAQVAVGMYVTGAILTTQATQYGINVTTTGSSVATNEITSVGVTPVTQAAAFTVTTVTSFHAGNPVKGAGSTITSAYGLLVDSITSGNTNCYGVYVGAPSGGSGENIAVASMGSTQLGLVAAASSTTGYVYITSIAGTPTGVPVASGIWNGIPIVMDSTAGKLWARTGGAWKSVTFV